MSEQDPLHAAASRYREARRASAAADAEHLVVLEAERAAAAKARTARAELERALKALGEAVMLEDQVSP